MEDAEDLEEPEVEEEEFEEILEQVEDSLPKEEREQIYDYRKKLPFVNYSNIDAIEKIQNDIQHKICNEKGKFISSESGKVRSAIRRVAIATNSKDIDATELLNELYAKKSFFNKELKISSKELPEKLNIAFESFKRQFNTAIDEGNLSKEDQDVIYEYMIRPRELVRIKEDIKNGKFKAFSNQERDISDSDEFRENLEKETKEPHEIDANHQEYPEEDVKKIKSRKEGIGEEYEFRKDK